MELLIFAAGDSARAAALQQTARGQGHAAARVAPGQGVPAARDGWSSAVCFAESSAPLPPQVHAVHAALANLSIPLIVVSNASADERSRAETCGAALVCPADAADDVILAELQARRQAAPVGRELRAQLVEPFVAAVDQTLRQMAGVDIAVLSVYERPTRGNFGELQVALTLSQTLDGVLIMGFGLKTAEALWRRIAAEEGQPLDPHMIGDCAGEIVNVVAGQAKALLAGTPYHFHFSTPSVYLGQQSKPFPLDMKSVVIAFDSDVGPMTLQVCRA